jgi:DNA-binding NarL/FixJ family response regulator
MAERLPHAAPVVATVHDDDEHLFEAITAGAQGYLVKSQEATALAARLRRIDDGEPPLSPSIARRIMAHFRDQAREEKPLPPETDLTPRELEVLTLLAKGSRVAEAAQRLGLTEQTVATYVKLIYRKLRISSRAEAALAAARRGLV